MKNLILLSMLVLMTACNGAGGGSASSGEVEGEEPTDFTNSCVDANNNVVTCTNNVAGLEIEYDSHGFYQSSGISLDLMGTFDQDRPIVLPEFIERLEDSNNVLTFNDKLRIVFVTTQCDWHWNGTKFEFFACNGLLTGSISGDTIYLSDLHNAAQPQMDGKIQMGVVRNPLANYTGVIRAKANLQ